ncbi:MAG: beta-galactosidase GalB [Bacteroidales bacterium]
MKKLNLLLTGSFILLSAVSLFATGVRVRDNFNEGWKFHLGNATEAAQPKFDDSQWRPLTLPHDWSIEGEFSDKNPATAGGGALPGGIGWYRKSFRLPASDSSKLLFVEFDGIYRNSEVWINGKYLGKRPYGYSSFRYELTPYLNFGDKPNVISVKVDNSQQPNSRWYSGSGIYRNVWLVKTSPVAVDHWGTFVTTPRIDANGATVNIKTRINNATGKAVNVIVKSIIYDADNKPVAEASLPKIILKNPQTEIQQTLTVKNPMLWSVDNPVLYHIVTTVSTKQAILDEYDTPIGIRSFDFDAEKGFILNGKQLKIKGVCNHHDLGCLGSAINTRALERQLELLKEMGCNSIRTSHNPPAPELLDLCDKMGFIVMDEAFDMWKKKKTDFDYGLDFDQWHKTDLQDMVLRDRNHPSVFIWSIGNEILEQWDSTGISIARELAGIVRELDQTRPITSACNQPDPSNFIVRSGALDLIGYNYHHNTFSDFPKTFPGKKFIASETTSALATRGSYDMPADSIRRWPIQWDKPFVEGNADLSCSAYDNCSAPWGSTHEETWKIIKKYDFLSGMYIWTGFDYLGEPTPYTWPARSSYFGILDLCGFPKDAFYMYQSEWTNKPVLHILPHWNWKPGQTVDVWVYSSCNEVELFLNGRSLGIQHKSGDQIHLSWKVPFEAGTLHASGRNNGKEIITNEIKTAGLPAKIILTPDHSTIQADGNDLSYITAQVVDQNNVPVPDAGNLIYFSVQGNGSIAGVDNGNPISMESFKSHERRAFHGKCILVVKAGKDNGPITVTANADGLLTATQVVQTKK